MIQIKLVHGSWKNEDSNKIHIDEAVKRHVNIQSITAHMPEAYGTHHSKMIVLFRHDDQAQYGVSGTFVVIINVVTESSYSLRTS